MTLALTELHLRKAQAALQEELEKVAAQVNLVADMRKTAESEESALISEVDALDEERLEVKLKKLK